MSGGFFRGTSADQDTRFSNKQAKLLKSQKFASELENLVDMSKVKIDVLKPWIAKRVTELIGFEDEVLINFIYTLLEGKAVNGKQVQISLTGFMERNTGKFMKELWLLLLSAQQNASGVPQEFLDAKEEETKMKKAETDRIANEIHLKREKEKKEFDEEKIKMDGRRGTLREKHAISENDAKHDRADDDERHKRNSPRRRRRVSRSSGSVSHSPSPSRKHSPSPSKLSNSRSHSNGRRSRSISGARKSRSLSVSSERQRHSSPRRSMTPRRRRHGTRRSPSPPRRRSPPSSQRSISRTRRRSPSPARYRVRSSWRYRSRSPLRHRSRSPRRHRSRSPVRRSSMQYKSRSPVQRRSPSPVRRGSPSPVRHRSPSPMRRRSPSPVRRRSPSPVRGRSLSPDQDRSASPVRRRSPPPVRRRSSPPVRRRSPPPARRSSPSPYGRRAPVHRRRSPVPSRRRRSPSTPPKPSSSPVRPRSSMHDRDRSLTPVNRSPSDQSSRSPSPTRHHSLSPVQRGSVRNARSPVQSPRQRVRSRKEYSPDRYTSSAGDRKPVVSLRSPQRDSLDFDDVHGKDGHLSPSAEKIKLPDASRDRSHGSKRRSTSPRGSPYAKSERMFHPEGLGSLPKAVASKPRRGDSGSSVDDRDVLSRRETGEPKLSSSGKVSPMSDRRKDSLEPAEGSGLPDAAKSRKSELARSDRHPDRVDCRADRESQELSTIHESTGVNKEKESSDSYRVIDKNKPRSDDRKGSYGIMDEEALPKSSKKSEKNGSVVSDPIKIDDHRVKVKEKRKHRKLDREEAVSDDYSSEDSYEDRREAKKRRKEERKLKKEERRRRREERRRRKEEKRSEKRKSKSVDSGSSSSDLEQDHSEDDSVRRQDSQSNTQDSESRQKKLEIELREKALESLRAKRGIGN